MMDGMGVETSAAPGAAPGFEAALEIESGVADQAEPRLAPGLEAEPGPGLPFEAFLNPVELQLAHTVVDGLEPSDPQEEIHCWHLAVTHLLAAQRIGKSRQEGLSARAEQIEIGLAVRIMTLADRKSTALDRHRAFKQKAAREEKREAERTAWTVSQTTAQTAAREAAQAGDPAGGLLPVPGAPDRRISKERADPSSAAAAAHCAEAGAPTAKAGLPLRRVEACLDEAPGSMPGVGPGSEPGADSGSIPGASPWEPPAAPVPAAPGHSPGQARLTRQQRRALARREKKAAQRLARLG